MPTIVSHMLLGYLISERSIDSFSANAHLAYAVVVYLRQALFHYKSVVVVAVLVVVTFPLPNCGGCGCVSCRFK